MQNPQIKDLWLRQVRQGVWPLKLKWLDSQQSEMKMGV